MSLLLLLCLACTLALGGATSKLLALASDKKNTDVPVEALEGEDPDAEIDAQILAETDTSEEEEEVPDQPVPPLLLPHSEMHHGPHFHAKLRLADMVELAAEAEIVHMETPVPFHKRREAEMLEHVNVSLPEPDNSLPSDLQPGVYGPEVWEEANYTERALAIMLKSSEEMNAPMLAVPKMPIGLQPDTDPIPDSGLGSELIAFSTMHWNASLFSSEALSFNVSAEPPPAKNPNTQPEQKAEIASTEVPWQVGNYFVATDNLGTTATSLNLQQQQQFDGSETFDDEAQEEEMHKEQEQLEEQERTLAEDPNEIERVSKQEVDASVNAPIQIVSPTEEEVARTVNDTIVGDDAEDAGSLVPEDSMDDVKHKVEEVGDIPDKVESDYSVEWKEAEDGPRDEEEGKQDDIDLDAVDVPEDVDEEVDPGNPKKGMFFEEEEPPDICEEGKHCGSNYTCASGAECGTYSNCTGAESTCGDYSHCTALDTDCGQRSLCTGKSSTCGKHSQCKSSGDGLTECDASSVCSGPLYVCGADSACNESPGATLVQCAQEVKVRLRNKADAQAGQVTDYIDFFCEEGGCYNYKEDVWEKIPAWVTLQLW